MPTYDYQCSACKHSFEQFQSFSEEKLVKCPECKKNKLERLYGIGIHYHVENVTTVGQLGERNAKKAGKTKMQEENAKYVESKNKHVKVHKQPGYKEYRDIVRIKDKKKYIETGIKT